MPTLTSNTETMISLACTNLSFEKYQGRLFLLATGLEGAIHTEYLELDGKSYRIHFENDYYQVVEVDPSFPGKGMNYCVGLPISFGDLEHDHGKFSLGFMAVEPPTDGDGSGGLDTWVASSSMTGFGTIHITDIDGGQFETLARPVSAPNPEDNNSMGSAGTGGSSSNTTNTETEEQLTFWQKVKGFFKRIFTRNEDAPLASDPTLFTHLEAPQQFVFEHQILLNTKANMEISGVSAFDIIMMRTNNENIRITRRSA